MSNRLKEVVIVSAIRTPIGTYKGSLKNIKSDQLGSMVIKEVLKKSKFSGDEIDEVIMGQVLTAGTGQNPARQAAVNAGIPISKPAHIVNQVCGSGQSGLVSQQLMNNAFGESLIPGVLLKGLVLNAFQIPELIKHFLITSGSSSKRNSINSSLFDISISTERNLRFSPRFIDLTSPPAGDVKKTPGFFLSSKIFWPALTISPTFTIIVGFIPIKSLPSKETDEHLGSSVIDKLGLPDIGKSRPLDIFITLCVPS